MGVGGGGHHVRRELKTVDNDQSRRILKCLTDIDNIWDVDMGPLCRLGSIFRAYATLRRQ